MSKQGKVHPSCVYFIGTDKEIKIGVSTNIEYRLDTFQTSQARRLELMGVQYGSFQLENILHLRFKHLHIDGEWFRKDKELIRYIEANAFHTSFSYLVAIRYLDWLKQNASYQIWVDREFWHYHMMAKTLENADISSVDLDWLQYQHCPYWGDELKKHFNVSGEQWLSLWPEDFQKQFLKLKPIQQLVFVRDFYLGYLNSKNEPDIPKQLPLF